jgi:NTE family protein
MNTNFRRWTAAAILCSLAWVGTAMAAIFVGTIPLFSMLIGQLWGLEHITRGGRIGLVLGGGGAKGAAHVGVLSVLEELRIPVDCVIGTSMGALVGGTFASGVEAKELEKAIRSIS